MAKYYRVGLRVTTKGQSFDKNNFVFIKIILVDYKQTTKKAKYKLFHSGNTENVPNSLAPSIKGYVSTLML